MNKYLMLPGLLFILSCNVQGSELTRLMPEQSLLYIANEISGTKAKRNLDQITQYHRMRGSKEFNKAAAHVLSELQSYGYNDAEIIRFPADGKTMFGTQKSRLAWNVDAAELWELTKQEEHWLPARRLADWGGRPLTLAQDSDSADVVADLIDIGKGTNIADYEDKQVEGKIVLTSSQPEAVEALAIVKYGAVGVLSYAANQKSAWWQLDDNLVRWGHLSSFRDYQAFGFMTTLAEARSLKSRLQAGEQIRFHAKVEARREVGEYQIVSAMIPGSDPQLAKESIVFSCHLDHPRPGANDNASGCVAILEVARALKVLVASGKIPAPKRTIRFIWPAEIEATIIYLNQKPKLAATIKHLIHMDMVGGGPETKAVFRLSRGPSSVADISGEIAFSIVDFVNQHSLDYASGIDTDFALVSSEGGREPLLAQKEWLSVGSDHDVFASGSWSIPVTYLHDWPDRYIHTSKDVAANIDPSKLKRSAFIGMVQAMVMANLGNEHGQILSHILSAKMIERTAKLIANKGDLSAVDGKASTRGHWANEEQVINSIKHYAVDTDVEPLRRIQQQLMPITTSDEATTETTASAVIYRRNQSVKGTMHGFGYSYLEDKLNSNKLAFLQLPKQPSGYEIGYEALNLVNGQRSLSQIQDRLIYQFGSVQLDAVSEYLEALASIGVIEVKK